jgi:hypothetical protein
VRVRSNDKKGGGVSTILTRLCPPQRQQPVQCERHEQQQGLSVLVVGGRQGKVMTGGDYRDSCQPQLKSVYPDILTQATLKHGPTAGRQEHTISAPYLHARGNTLGHCSTSSSCLLGLGNPTGHQRRIHTMHCVST